jgi:uncharacterized RDD family membrane protein YckC
MKQPSGHATSQPVGLARRLAALVYDTLLLIGLWFFATLAALPFSGGEPLGPHPLYRAWLLLVAYGFFAGFWTHGGQTLGMRAWRIRVTDVNGGAVTWPRATLRFLAALVSGLALGLGFLWALVDREGRTWHDRWSDTRLVRLP